MTRSVPPLRKDHDLGGSTYYVGDLPFEVSLGHVERKWYVSGLTHEAITLLEANRIAPPTSFPTRGEAVRTLCAHLDESFLGAYEPPALPALRRIAAGHYEDENGRVSVRRKGGVWHLAAKAPWSRPGSTVYPGFRVDRAVTLRDAQWLIERDWAPHLVRAE